MSKPSSSLFSAQAARLTRLNFTMTKVQILVVRTSSCRVIGIGMLTCGCVNIQWITHLHALLGDTAATKMGRETTGSEQMSCPEHMKQTKMDPTGHERLRVLPTCVRVRACVRAGGAALSAKFDKKKSIVTSINEPQEQLSGNA